MVKAICLYWWKLSKYEKKYLENLIRRTKTNYAKKFDRLYQKQKDLRTKAKYSIGNNISLRVKKNKKDHSRYKKRKRLAKKAAKLNRAEFMILNKSSYLLQDNDKLLLLRGLNFVPTPKWSERTENLEWQYLFDHIRRIEWNYIFKEQTENDNKSKLENLPPN